jgi:type IV pilus assembly protein PilE
MRNRGFTIIELMTVVAIMAIIVAIAIPAYQDYVRRSRRAEAISLLQDLALREEQFRSNNPAFSSTLGVPTSTESPYYTISIQAATATRYLLRAVATGDQVNDTASCRTMELEFNNGVTTRRPSPDTDRCWGR